MPASCIRLPGFEFWFQSQFQILAGKHPERHQVVAKVAASLPPSYESCIVFLVPGHLGSEQNMKASALCFSKKLLNLMTHSEFLQTFKDLIIILELPKIWKEYFLIYSMRQTLPWYHTDKDTTNTTNILYEHWCKILNTLPTNWILQHIKRTKHKHPVEFIPGNTRIVQHMRECDNVIKQKERKKRIVTSTGRKRHLKIIQYPFMIKKKKKHE